MASRMTLLLSKPLSMQEHVAAKVAIQAPQPLPSSTSLLAHISFLHPLLISITRSLSEIQMIFQS
jgi:hypothetical protein